MEHDVDEEQNMQPSIRVLQGVQEGEISRLPLSHESQIAFVEQVRQLDMAALQSEHMEPFIKWPLLQDVHESPFVVHFIQLLKTEEQRLQDPVFK